MSQKWLLLDFDNTLMETEKWVLPSLVTRFNDLYGSQIGHPLTLDEFKTYFHGQGREILCTNLSIHFNIAVDYETLYENRDWHVMQHLATLPAGVAMAPHLIETLTTLKAQNYKFAFVSNNSVQRGMTAMRYADNKRGEELAALIGCHYFEASSDRQKPLPDVYHHAIAQTSGTPVNSYAIEDSPTGLKAALAAGLKTFAYGGFADNRAEHRVKMLELGAADWFDDWAQLPALLQSA